MELIQSLGLLALAMVAGAFFPTQAGINHQLAGWTQSPVIASAISFAVGTVTLIVCLLVSRIPMPDMGQIGVQPWWVWIGGVLGAFSVYSMVFLAPRLGASSMLACILAGQMTAALLLDQFGVLGYAQQNISWQRIVGLILIFVGVYLMRII
ncbi:MAG: DMT family transporter [Proteobacteria bacterium]|nr:DMT family transporter [Pseudomonadota bacterium]